MRYFFFPLILGIFFQTGLTQQALQIETYGKAKTQKIFAGEELEYRMKGTEDWRLGIIENFRADQGLIVLGDRYVRPDDIAAFRYHRPGMKRFGLQLGVFGLAWSGFAAIGTATDNNPETRYRWSDAIVTASAITVGLALPKVFQFRTIRFGKRKRLRIVDLNFDQG